MFRDLTPTSFFWIFLGLLLFGYGVYNGYYWRNYPYAAGLSFLGIGGILCGITNGFADYSPMGRLLFKIGIPLLLLGLLLTGYNVLKFI